MIKFFYTIIMLLSIPVSALLIFKPNVWQNFYHAFYHSNIEFKGGKILKTITKSLLSMSATEAGETIHRSLGIILAIVILYIFYAKLQIVSAF